ncbi:MAG: ribonuclease E/G, partial [Eubacteriales bacterium]|nr:ribonuclease E/G [Eubacteriales bacterium]
FHYYLCRQLKGGGMDIFMKVLISVYREKLLGFALEQGKVIEVFPAQLRRETFAVGDIVLGHVKEISPRMEAAFVRLLPAGKKADNAYLSFREMSGDPPSLRREQDIPVQIAALPVGSKPAKLTQKLTLSGRYCVVGLQTEGLHFSKKIAETDRERLRKQLPDSMPYGVIIRTEAAQLLSGEESAGGRKGAGAEEGADSLSPLLAELDALQKKMDEILRAAASRTSYSVLYQEEAAVIAGIRALRPEEIVIDRLPDAQKDSHLQRELEALCGTLQEEFVQVPVRRIPEDGVSYLTLWGIPSQIEEALGKRVWLPSGGYLVIERTEALTAIDVNSGRSDAFSPSRRKSGAQERQAAVRALNEEAAEESFRQIRLRNLSGMILIDFLNMEDREQEEALLAQLRSFAAKDPIHTRAVDITALGLAEITRKKTDAPIADWL